MTKPNSQTGRVTFLEGRGDLPMLEIATPWSSAGLYLHGAHVTHFQKQGEPPLLFMSQCSRFEPGAPIRGGIPIIFPWFGKSPGKPGQHGFARVKVWELTEVLSPPDGSVTVRLRLPGCAELPGIEVNYLVTVGETLAVELIVLNKSSAELNFENCLHTYFLVGDINAVSVAGLQGVDYLDSLADRARKTETAEVIRFTGEVDRVYVDTPHAMEIRDCSLRRTIRVEKSGSASTVVWNPWIAKAKSMSDFGDEEYQTMVCVESGNVAMNQVELAAGQSAKLKVKLSSAPLL